MTTTLSKFNSIYFIPSRELMSLISVKQIRPFESDHCNKTRAKQRQCSSSSFAPSQARIKRRTCTTDMHSIAGSTPNVIDGDTHMKLIFPILLNKHLQHEYGYITERCIERRPNKLANTPFSAMTYNQFDSTN